MRWSEARTVAALTIFAALIRLYLSLTSFCISGDGVGYIKMGQSFAGGDWSTALGSVFSPLYPLLVAAMHQIVPRWELAGDLVSTVFGTATIPILYFLMREVFGSRLVATGAAAAAAIDPSLAEYSASVRTEAGYIALMLVALLCLVWGIRRQNWTWVAAAGLVGAMAYLYRTEAIGLIAVSAVFLLAGPRLWRRWSLSDGARWAAVFIAAFLVVASPYLFYLRQATGHWTVGREFRAAMTFGIADMHRNKTDWRMRAWSDDTSAFAPILREPATYAKKAGGDLLFTPYFFVQALGPVLSILLGIGLWERGKRILHSPFEALLVAMVTFYAVGLALSYTGPRFMVHLTPYCFGWISIGLIRASSEAIRLAHRREFSLPAAAVPIAVALALLPQTLWPIGWDLRAFKYAAREVQGTGRQGALVASDGRAAFYAGTDFIQLPVPTPPFCHWLGQQKNPGYLLLSAREEKSVLVADSFRCLDPLRRYPHGRWGYFDLFKIRLADGAKPNG